MFKNKPLTMTNNKYEAKSHNITDDYEISNTVLGKYFLSENQFLWNFIKFMHHQKCKKNMIFNRTLNCCTARVQIIGLGINGKVVECTNKKNLQKYALKVLHDNPKSRRYVCSNDDVLFTFWVLIASWFIYVRRGCFEAGKWDENQKNNFMTKVN